MYFQCRDGWPCQFLEAYLKTSLPRRLHFASSNKVVQLHERAAAWQAIAGGPKGAVSATGWPSLIENMD
jgi:hypothetical protein